jgi:shikimate dehydrogenase
MRLVDSVTEAARDLQCINCITFKNGESTGHNTDAPGLRRALKAHRINKSGPAVILGAGGAARAAVVALREHGLKQIAVINRSAPRRRAFAPFAKTYDVTLHPWSELDAACADARLIVNATSAQVKHEGIDLPWIQLGTPVIYDLTYGKTPLVAAAQKQGLKAFDGSRMLLEQAATAFELWTGKKAPIDVMASVLR